MNTKVLIIGAGFYGLSLAQACHDKGIDHVVVGDSFSLWRKHMIFNMSLRSDRNASEFFTYDNRFNLKQYILDHHDPKILKSSVPLDVFKAYMTYVESNLTCNHVKSLVTSLEKKNGSFIAKLKNGKTITAQKVIISTGIGLHKYLPKSLEKIEGKNCIHTYNISKVPRKLEKKRILIIGGGQSAAEIIDAYCKKNKITWMYRSPPIWYNEPINLPKPIFNAMLSISNLLKYLPFSLRDKIRRRYVETTITPKLQYIEKEKSVSIVQKDIDGASILKKLDTFVVDGITYDLVLAATGYKYDLENFSWMKKNLQKKIKTTNNIPNLSGYFESSVKGLFFIGGIAEFRHGPGQRFLIGSKYALITIMKKLM